ncbi:bacteriohopanetetrol glucosamine biosynthesis glycosyltransferase HpnI [Nostoc cf. edaphicum LEGE 07299]|uniref:Bacteriohopanetetrol glucosamine biosynthesis glycosyltransferase HpnI n=1 Tax=Nostoc cf. edaphicum LEGE 07299 TaxID=2777974 RepID=A0ABR9TY00_9NOSO|nr:bacteriohopanetetrol glucosamine biosynthesis glycosyltransferase HpnI [Nostoc edaphicum]MBE9104967.1 bacteriohopanetetrol glucosamine biosynthesis glycosyltransferase HpnI [Nostoc cf. edaphicum LEGE 07299]
MFASTFLTNLQAIASNFLLILCIPSVLFYCYAIYAAISFFAAPQAVNQEFHPPVSILKPICGLDRDAYENLASFCQQNYPKYQIIFAVRNSQDPCIEVVDKIIQNFSDLDILLIVSDRVIGTNLKVSNLANAATKAKYEILVLADSDIRVGTDYLQRVIQPLQDESVGVVTCMYRSLTQGWISILEAINTTTEFHAAVLVSNIKENGIKYAFGCTIAIPKKVLEAIGGFEAIADYLADDFQLGYLPVQAGYKVVLSDYIVEHLHKSNTLIDVIKRQIRWAFCKRVSRPWGYLGLIFTYGIVTSLLLLIATNGSIIGWLGLCICWVTRLVMAWVVGTISLKDPIVKKFLWLVPGCDLLSFVIWCFGFIGNTMEWRGQQLKLTKDGKLLVPEDKNDELSIKVLTKKGA